MIFDRVGIVHSIFHIEGRAVLRARLAPVVQAGSGNICVPQPLLHLSNIFIEAARFQVGGVGKANT